MSEIDIVKDLAQQTLTIPTLTGELDNSIWDRAQRLVRNAEYICRLPELANLQIDRFCLYAAAYFSDAGLVRPRLSMTGGARHLKAEKPTLLASARGREALLAANGNNLLDFSTQVVEEKLSPAIDQARIKKINRIITESGSHSAQRPEAMILSDARNLDDMGAVGILNEFRRFVSAGKGICDALQSWKRKIDYRYWQARLKKSFRFEQVRKLAEQRLSVAEYFMNQLKAETEAQDLEELITESPEGKSKKVKVRNFVHSP